MVDVELDLPLGLLTRIDDDQVQVAVRPSSALGPRPEKDDLLGMDRFGDDLHHTLDHRIGAHVRPPVSSLAVLSRARVKTRAPILHPLLRSTAGQAQSGGGTIESEPSGTTYRACSQ